LPSATSGVAQRIPGIPPWSFSHRGAPRVTVLDNLQGRTGFPGPASTYGTEPTPSS
jgi:hypothetical protein